MNVNKATIERLSSFARLWGKVYLFHPAVGAHQFDLGPPTIAAINDILQSRTKDSYRGAIETFLSALKDPRTKIVDKERTENGSRRVGVTPEWQWTKDKVGVLRLTAFEPLGDNLRQALGEAVKNLLTSPSGLVFDVRGCQWSTGAMVVGAVRNLIDRPIPCPTESWRRHSGFASEGQTTSGGYYSSFQIAEHKPFTPDRTMRKRGLRCPIVILANDEYEPIVLGAALWYAGLGGLVVEGDTAVTETIAVPLAGNLMVSLRVGDWINPDGSTGFAPTARVKRSNAKTSYMSSAAVRVAVNLARHPKKPPTAKTPKPRSGASASTTNDPSLPDVGSRIFAWIRLWNVIHYFFPYHELADRSWDDALPTFMPKFASAKTALDYAIAAAEACTWMDDSHAGVFSQAFNEFKGDHYPQLRVRRIEDRFVVTEMDPSVRDAGLRVGDVIEAVDGLAADDVAARMRSYIAYSTEQSFYRSASNFLLAGDPSPVEVAIKRRGKTHTIKVERSATWWEPSSGELAFSVIPEGYGYIDLVRLETHEVDACLVAVKNTPALIIDIRGYPRGAMFTLAPRLTSKKVSGASFSRPEVIPHGESPTGLGMDPSPTHRFIQTISPSAGIKYEKPIAVLIDERAFSQSEHSCLFVGATSNVTFVGTPTTGANGDVTVISLPGQLLARFTGHDIRHPDGRQLQRLGILPDIKVGPTIAGIRAGRDEVLSAAVAHLKSVVD